MACSLTLLALFIYPLPTSLFELAPKVTKAGQIFRGHGGFLDRLDSLLFVLPFVYQVVLLWR